MKKQTIEIEVMQENNEIIQVDNNKKKKKQGRYNGILVKQFKDRLILMPNS